MVIDCVFVIKLFVYVYFNCLEIWLVVDCEGCRVDVVVVLVLEFDMFEVLMVKVKLLVDDGKFVEVIVIVDV